MSYKKEGLDKGSALEGKGLGMQSSNLAQARAIEFNEGPCLLIAGPGSGKTYTLIHRIQYLINRHKVSPENILVITFNRAAAIQIKERFHKKNKGAVYFSTFHSLFFSILRYAYNLSANSLIQANSQYNLIKEEFLKYELEYDNEEEILNQILSEIGKIKNEGLDLKSYKSKSLPEETFRKIFLHYEKSKYKKRLIDYDDFAPMVKRLLMEDEGLRQGLIKRFSYILIDEFQDINKLQFDVIRLLLSPKENLFVVGDDDQSIYSFRGSNPAFMLNFTKHFPKAKKLVLDTNYRSSPEIVLTAHNLIVHNKERYEKFSKSAKSKMEKPRLVMPEDNQEEKDFLISEIERLHGLGINYKDMAIFSRTNDLNKIYLKELVSHGIPVISDSPISNFYNSFVCQDILAYLKLAINDRSRANFIKIVNKPMRYITRSYLEDPVSLTSLREFYLGMKRPNKEVIKRIDDLIADIKMIGKMRPFAAINYIRKAVSYDDYIDDYARKYQVNKEGLIDDLDKIQAVSKNFNSLRDFITFIEEKQKEKYENDKSNGVNFLTLHRSKGLEFKVVFIMDVCENIIPLKQALIEEDIEEERRLFYVGITRAMEKLYIISPKRRYNKDVLPSCFIEEIGLEEN